MPAAEPGRQRPAASTNLSLVVLRPSSSNFEYPPSAKPQRVPFERNHKRRWLETISVCHEMSGRACTVGSPAKPCSYRKDGIVLYRRNLRYCKCTRVPSPRQGNTDASHDALVDSVDSRIRHLTRQVDVVCSGQSDPDTLMRLRPVPADVPPAQRCEGGRRRRFAPAFRRATRIASLACPATCPALVARNSTHGISSQPSAFSASRRATVLLMAVPSVPKHGGGQRPLTPGEVAVFLPVKVPKRLQTAYVQRAKELGISTSELVRNVLSGYIGDLPRNEDAA